MAASSSPLAGLFSSASRPFDLQAIFKTQGLTDDVQRHLARVYIALTLTVLTAALGVYVNMLYGIAGTGFLPLIALVGTMMYLSSTRGEVTTQRLVALLAFGFFKGLSLGNLIAMTLHTNPDIVVTALLGTATVFVCFSLAALLAKRREYLYLGGMLASAVMGMFIISLLNAFLFKSQLAFTAELYVGLLVFCGYVIFDTQMMIESAALGSRDYAWHALELYIDLVAIFVRLLIILNRNSEKKERQRKEQEASRRTTSAGRR